MDINYFNDSFSDIFNDSDMKVDEVEDDISRFISLLGANNTLETRYENVCNIVYKFLHKTSLMEMEQKIFQHLMPEITDLFVTIFKEISNIINTDENQDSSDCTLKLLHDAVVMCLGSYEVLDCILTNLLQNDIIKFCYIQTVPGELATILLTTFRHCKESEQVYNNYFSSLKEIIQLFKNAQDIHSKLLQLLLSHVHFNFEFEQEIKFLKDVLFTLGSMGQVLVDMNVKTLVDNWKGYIALIEKYSDVLIKNNFMINKPLELITLIIQDNLENVLKMLEADQKSYTHILKMSNFFLKNVIKLCDIFWQAKSETYSAILIFLCSVYRFYPQYLSFKNYSDSIINGIEQLVIKGCDPIIEKCLLECEFVKMLGGIDVKDNLNSPGFLFFIIDVFNKLVIINVDDLCTIRVDILVDIFFKIISESYVELFWCIQNTSSSKLTVFDECCHNISKVIQFLNAEQVYEIEVVLMKNLLQERIWNALIAVEIWHLMLRGQDAQATYDTLVTIYTITNRLLQNSVTSWPATVFIEHILHRLYTSLPESHRIQLIEKYSIQSHLQLWRCLTLNDFPVNCIIYIESLLIELIGVLQDFKNGKCSVTNFYFICGSFDVIATLPNNTQIDLRSLTVTILNLWDCEINASLIQNNHLLKYFAKKLLQVTSRIALTFASNELFWILLKVEALSSTFQIEILHMLKQLSHKSFNQFSEKSQIISALSSIFNNVYRNSNPIIKQLLLETFVYFLNTTSHEEVLQGVVKTNQQLQIEVSSFIQQNIVNQRGLQLLSADDYFTKQKYYNFQHKCPEILQIVKRSDTEHENVGLILKRLQTDLEALYQQSDKKFVENSVANIINGFS